MYIHLWITRDFGGDGRFLDREKGHSVYLSEYKWVFAAVECIPARIRNPLRELRTSFEFKSPKR